MARDIFDEVAQFEKKLGLKNDFYKELFDSDDWSFVIKLNALFEAACTQALVARLGSPEIIDELSHLDFSDKKAGKIRFLKILEVLTEGQAKFLYALAELRNKLVHNIEQVSFSITDYLVKLDKNQLKSVCDLWGSGLAEPLEIKGKQVSRRLFAQVNPKLSLWLTGLDILGCLHLEFELADNRKNLMERRIYSGILAKVEAEISAQVSALPDLYALPDEEQKDE